MFVFMIFLFIFVCCISVYFYFLLQEKDREIEELFDLYYEYVEKDFKKEFSKSKVVRLC